MLLNALFVVAGLMMAHLIYLNVKAIRYGSGKRSLSLVAMLVVFVVLAKVFSTASIEPMIVGVVTWAFAAALICILCVQVFLHLDANAYFDNAKNDA